MLRVRARAVTPGRSTGSWYWLRTRGDSVLLPKPAAELLGSVSYPEVGHLVLLSSSPGPTSHCPGVLLTCPVWGQCKLPGSIDGPSLSSSPVLHAKAEPRAGDGPPEGGVATPGWGEDRAEGRCTGEMLGSDCRLARVRHRELTASHPEITANTEQGVPVSTRGVWGTQASSHPSCHLVSSRAPCCLETKDQTSSSTFSLHKGPYLIIAPPTKGHPDTELSPIFQSRPEMPSLLLHIWKPNVVSKVVGSMSCFYQHYPALLAKSVPRRSL